MPSTGETRRDGLTVKSDPSENLNMSRERERFGGGTERMERGQRFPCLFSKFEEAGESFVM